MNKLILFFLLNLSFVVLSQTNFLEPKPILVESSTIDTIIYFNEYWCEEDSSNAVYYRVGKVNKYDHKQYHGKFQDYYMSNNQLQSKGRFKWGRQKGTSKYYYLNGQLMQINKQCCKVKVSFDTLGNQIYKKGKGTHEYRGHKNKLLRKVYVSNYYDSLDYEYSPKTGRLLSVSFEKNDGGKYLTGCKEVYDERTNKSLLDSNGTGEVEYYENSFVVGKGKYVNGFKDGVWVYYNRCDGFFKVAEYWENREYIKGVDESEIPQAVILINSK